MSHCRGLAASSTLDVKRPRKLTTWYTFFRIQDLVGWEKSNITDPQAIKGIVGELAAVLGPKVVENSAVVLF
jgi:arginine-tRNA-protein transferase